MNMKTLEYIGPKADGERHMKADTGIEWFPGDKRQVSAAHAEEFLKHPTSWREVPTVAATLQKAQAPQPDMLPEWAKKGIELGATDEQLEAIAQAGGPETEAGAALWLDAIGTAWGQPEGDTDPLAGIDDMDADQLHALAKKLGVKVHPATGAKKLREALRAAAK